MTHKFFLAIVNILTLCIIIAGVSLFLVNDGYWVAFVLIILGLLCLVSLIPFKINLKSIGPDIFFGFIDNSILAVMAIFGGYFAGVTGAILGGVVGNAITDGIAGIFEGYYAEKLRAESIVEERTVLRSAVGKMAGCLFGAGIVFLIANILNM
ncbi:MAG: hypothetical protein A3B90_00985 [Candidatus Magasanikbacteria bacterium RIFCSPHIGHO2_02_FULL_41_13]|uniref:Uncharacterized protein n=1 Tax=Candidatus Magasanikbacteria bacterium RIFCSPHIGHO2_02_FULL_41_13 TaxID=1798676 RepID=A0A1F6M4X3_9BACT|nr:MAG: hypothetical protein A3B90_00985 [Candidatus Magasanikbacteria bacterium RIFCSPHIGHO2_02_FULL_41_13]